ncbi:histidinol phosphate aminotransferase [Arenibacterium sp. CAU 1754]
MRDHKVTAAPDYTVPALIMAGINLTWVFIALWAVYGWVPVLALAVFINHLITRLEIRRSNPFR